MSSRKRQQKVAREVPSDRVRIKSTLGQGSHSDPHQPQSLRDLSVSLDRLGQSEMARGRLDAASNAYSESLSIRRGLSDPHQPHSLRDLSLSLEPETAAESCAKSTLGQG
jgi:hypothetical protein